MGIGLKFTLRPSSGRPHRRATSTVNQHEHYMQFRISHLIITGMRLTAPLSCDFGSVLFSHAALNECAISHPSLIDQQYNLLCSGSGSHAMQDVAQEHGDAGCGRDGNRLPLRI
jgi:hypothetical protein